MPDRVEGLRIVEHGGRVWIAALFGEYVMVGRADQPISDWARIDQPPFLSVEMVSTPGALVVVVGHDAEPASVWIHPDAGAWETLGLGLPFLPRDLAWIDGQLWLAGSRNASEAEGVIDMQPSLLVSDDGRSWKDLGATLEIGLSVDELRNRPLVSVVATEERVLAALAPGLADRSSEPIVVESTDRGLTWTKLEASGPVPSSLVVSAGTVFGFSAYVDFNTPPTPVVSLDPSSVWVPVGVDVYVQPEPVWAAPSAGPGPLIAVLAIWNSWRPCWYPLGETYCETSGVWFASGFESSSVGRIEVSDPNRSYPPLVTLSTSDGRIVTARTTRDGSRKENITVEVHAGDLVEPTPPLLGWTSEMSMEVGATYRIRLGTHCGIDHLASINGVDWYLASPAVGEPPPSDPEDTELLWGNITLVEDDRIVLDADGYLTAEYAPGPDLEAGCE